MTDDEGKVIEKEKEYSVIEAQDFNNTVQEEGTIKVKTFSDISSFDLKNTPKTSKVDGKFTSLKVKEFSCFGEVSVLSEETQPVAQEEAPEQKEFSAGDLKIRLRENKLGPRQYFRRVYMSYRQVIRSMGGIEKLKQEDIKILKSLFTSDVLLILNSVQSEVLKGKQLNTLLGCSSISKNARILCQELQIPLRYAYIEVKKQGFLSKLRYTKLQTAYMNFINGLINDVFGPNPEPIKEEPEDNKEE